ncbi:S1 family peptidase [Rhodococcus spongiicola]|uniref:Protease n=1 Tax=Rhodococcus spongiicola TaxID=2487352 RepID=A0A3S3AD57_9NOCA|nr:S1 family peptidase [Rhodococcus spongiicola]RVW01723.1 protease [Rhodococcus spongiicola]
MRSLLARPAAVLGAAALLVLGPATTVAQAQPAASSAASESSLSDQPAQLPIELTDALWRDLQLTPDQYLERSDLAQRLGEFAEFARSQFPEAFGGAWIDPSGVPVVGLTDNDDGVAKAAVERAGFTSTDVLRNEGQLESTRAALATWIGTLPPEIARSVGGATVDIADNDVVLRADGSTGDLLDLVPPFLGEAARVVLGPALATLQPATSSSMLAQYGGDAFLGGDPYVASGGGAAFECSLGFNAVDGNGAPVNISAGHCDPDRAAAGTEYASRVSGLSGNVVGTFERTSLEGYDYSILRPTAAAAPRFTNNGVRTPIAIPLPITGTANPVVGAPVCKAGSTSGFNCGVVTAVNQTVQVGERVLNGGFATNLCALQGDSGGPIVTGTLALGISSASNVGEFQSCAEANLGAFEEGESPELFATPINAILGQNPGLRLQTF